MECVTFKEKLIKALKDNGDIVLSEHQQEQMFKLAQRLVAVKFITSLTSTSL